MMENRGFLQDIGKFVDLFQEVILKVELVLSKLDEVIEMLKQEGDE